MRPGPAVAAGPGSAHVDAGEDENPLLGEVLRRRADAFPAETGILESAVGHLVGADAGDVADDGAAPLKLARIAERHLQVAGEDAGLQAETAVVHPGQRLVDRFDCGDEDDRPEDLLAGDLRGDGDVGEDGGRWRR